METDTTHVYEGTDRDRLITKARATELADQQLNGCSRDSFSKYLQPVIGPAMVDTGPHVRIRKGEYMDFLLLVNRFGLEEAKEKWEPASES